MKELIKVSLIIIFAVVFFLNIKRTDIIIIFLVLVLILYVFTKKQNFLYLILFFIFYIYLDLVTYNGNMSGEKSLYVKFDGKTGAVLRIDNKYTDKKIFISNPRYSYGYYNLRYRVQQVEEREGIYVIKGKIKDIREGRLNFIRNSMLLKFEKIFESEYNICEFSKAAILGEKGNIGEDFNTMFKNTGLAHLLVISGLHIGLVIMVFLKIFEKIIFSYRLKYIMTWILLTGYCAVVGFSVSVLRAYITGSIMIFSKIFFEEKDTRKSYFISLIITIVLLPYSLFDISFQLSYGAVGSILFVYPVFEKLYIIKWKVKDNFLDYIIKILLLSFIIQIMTFPVFLYNFQVLPIFSFLCNIVGIPLGTLLIQIIFISLIFNILEIEFLNKFFLLLTKLVFNSFESIIYFLDKVPLLQLNVKFQIHGIFILIYYVIVISGIGILNYYVLNYKHEKGLLLK